MAISQRPDTPLAATPEPTVQDTTKTLSPYMVKRMAQQKVREVNIRKRDSVLQRNANVAGITREELQKQQAKNNKKPDVPTSGLCTSKSDGGKGSCTTGNKAEKRTVRNIR